MPNNNDKGRALARFAINTITSSRVGNILFPKKKMSKELKQAAGKRSLINDIRNFKGEGRKKHADSMLQDLRKRHFGIQKPRLDKTNFKQEAPLLYNTKNPLNYHGGDPGEEKINKHGEIKQAPSKAEQFYRKVKNTPAGTPGTIGFLKTIASGALTYSPLGILGKGKKLKQIAKAFGNTGKQYKKIGGVGGSNLRSFGNQMKSAIKPKTNREKVTGLSEKYFKNVQKSLEANPKLKKSSSGYYTFK